MKVKKEKQQINECINEISSYLTKMSTQLNWDFQIMFSTKIMKINFFLDLCRNTDIFFFTVPIIGKEMFYETPST